MSTAELIRTYIESYELDEPFTPAALLRFGTRKAVDLQLARLVKAGILTRPARGVYIRPKSNKYAGMVQPEPFKVALAKANAPIEVHGGEAARYFGFSTQMQVRPVYYTTGPSRRIKYGGMLIVLKHVSPRKMVAPGTKVGLAVSALWYLGKEQVRAETFAKIRNQLSEAEYEQLKATAPMMPAWMSDALLRYEQGLAHA
ncbi:MAG: type IV toxin-antitoxin system AbiEi family antitoxin domain-containing protein [Cyanobacteria bacterium SZAS TMP-1]|nr:type IV toxin-antitoxin system AbiEi family antitoxin domain-containing protein [Cyanobacteria bacterium SZAS TMP-1]